MDVALLYYWRVRVFCRFFGGSHALRIERTVTGK